MDAGLVTFADRGVAPYKTLSAARGEAWSLRRHVRVSRVRMNELRRIRAFLPRHIHRQYLGRGIPYRRYRGNTLRPLLEGERQVRAGETAQSIQRDRGLLGDRTQARPSERDRLGVTGRGRHRDQPGEIHADTLCELHLRKIMTRRRHPPLAHPRSLPESSQTATREMDTIGTELMRDFVLGVQLYAHACRL